MNGVIDKASLENITAYFEWVKASPLNAIAICVDILLVIYFVKLIYDLIKDTNAVQLVKGVIVLVLIMLVSEWLHLYILNFILRSIMTYGVFLIMIIFQPELRKALVNIGNNRKWAKMFKFKKETDTTEKTINEILDACEAMASKKTGALIILTRKTKLSDYASTGVELNAEVTKELLINIFEPNTPLHDGAVLIDYDKIKAAACILPLTKRTDLRSEFGTRHRACIGISEVADCIALVVSEETGHMSVAVDGKISTNLSRQQLEKFIQKELEQ